MSLNIGTYFFDITDEKIVPCVIISGGRGWR